MRLRNTKLDYTGRSLILNIAAIIINLVALFFVAKGFHVSTSPEWATAMIIGGIAMLVITLASLAVLKGMFLFSYVARAIVGGLFIVSGLVKANDPWGFAFKLEEYFEPGGLAFDYPFFEAFHDYAIYISVLVCVAEIVIGAAIILGGKIKLASWALIILMIFFTWLTWYTYSCNIKQMLAMANGEDFGRQCVTDCGCFGDALRGSVGRSLTPLESFWKDLVLFYLAIIIFVNQWKIKINTVKENWIMVIGSLLVVCFFSWVFGWILPIFFTIIALLGAFIAANLNIGKIGKAWKMAIFVTFLSTIFSLYTVNYLPFKDYRPYKIGNNIKEQMNNGVDQVAEYVMVYENLQTGKMDSVLVADWTNTYSDTLKYKYISNVPKILVEGVDPSILDFAAQVDFDKLSENEKQIAYIDSLIRATYNDYYEEKMVLETIYGMDTIAVVDYDTIYYPDSIYTKKGQFTGLIDPSSTYALDLTEYLLQADYVFLMTIRSMDAINENSIADFKAVLAGAREKNIPFFVLSPAASEEVEAFKKKNEFDATFLGFDGTEVKIIVRSTPGLVLLKKGTVLDKWPSRSVADFEDIYNDYITDKEN